MCGPNPHDPIGQSEIQPSHLYSESKIEKGDKGSKSMNLSLEEGFPSCHLIVPLRSHWLEFYQVAILAARGRGEQIMERRNGFVCFFQPQGNHYSDSYHHRFILPVLELHTQNILLYLAYFIQHYVHKFPSFFFFNFPSSRRRHSATFALSLISSVVESLIQKIFLELLLCGEGWPNAVTRGNDWWTLSLPRCFLTQNYFGSKLRWKQPFS